MDDPHAIRLRKACAHDQSAIVALVHSERLNPHGLEWPRFHVADAGGQVVGVVQIRRHADGAAELGSLAVRPEARGRGVALRLVEVALADAPHPVYIITLPRLAARLADFAFRPVTLREAPRSLRTNYLLGAYGAGLLSWLRLRRRRRLVMLRRAAPDA